MSFTVCKSQHWNKKQEDGVPAVHQRKHIIYLELKHISEHCCGDDIKVLTPGTELGKNVGLLR